MGVIIVGKYRLVLEGGGGRREGGREGREGRREGGEGGEGRGGREGEGGMTVIHILIGMFNSNPMIPQYFFFILEWTTLGL